MSESAAPSGRARIELLVRRQEGEGFELRQVGSGPAFLQLRPIRVDPDSFELAEVPSRIGEHESRFILKNTKSERFILVTAQERFLWERMDGSASLQDMATAYVLAFGAFDFELIPRLIRKLQAAQLLRMHPVSRLRRALERNRNRRAARIVYTALTGLERINVSSQHVHRFFAALYRYGGFLLFRPIALVAILLLSAAGMASCLAVWRDLDAIVRGFGGHAVWAVITVKLLLILTIGVHQVVHGLACVHHGRHVREFGFTFVHGIVPTFYVDVTDIFMASRRGRLVTAISGTLVHLVLGSVWFVLAVNLQPGFWQAFAAASGIIQWQTFVISLYPFCFIEMDGYHVLVDMLGEPTLKSQALDYVASVFQGTAQWPIGRQQAVYLAYVGLSALSIGAFVAFNVKLIVHVIS
jgi:putative peptide zinc metalloprotease protein